MEAEACTFVVWGSVLYFLLDIDNRMGRFTTITGGGVNPREFYEAVETLRPYYLQIGDIVAIKVLYGAVEVIDKIEITSIVRNKVGLLYVEYDNHITGTSGTVSEKDLKRLYLQHIER